MSNITFADICFSARRPRSINDSINIPFYIFAPDYRNNSGGIRVLHYLCHILNEMGEDAYVVNTRTVSPRLRTPQLTLAKLREHYLAGQQPVTIYPEVTADNPLNTPLIVRWLLNIPGHLGKPIQFEPRDLIFYYEAWCMPEELQGTPLFIHPVDHSFFNNDDNSDDAHRVHECYYANKYYKQGAPICEEHRDLISLGQEISRTPEEIAAILRKSKVLYCYEPSGIISEAHACGCPVLFVRSDYWALPPNDTHHKIQGAAVYGEVRALERAQESLSRIPAVHAAARDNSWVMTKTLIEHIYAAQNELQNNGKPLANRLQTLWSKPQKERKKSVDEFCNLYLDSGIHFPDMGNISSGRFRETYLTWRSRKTLQEIDGQLLGERMTKQWTCQPSIEVFVDPRIGEEALLADTFDSLTSQWYPHWSLTLLADFPPLDPSLTELEQIHWWVRDPSADPDAEVAEVLANCTSDWLLLLEPGITLEAHALAFFADTINVNPQAQLIYCDEDVREQDGQLLAPRFKPDTNLELLRNMYYLGPALLVRKTALDAVGGWRNLQSATFYDLTLRLLDHFGASALVHLDEILTHTPSHSLREIDTESELDAVRRHLARNQITAEVSQGLLQGTQQLRYLTEEQPLVSIIIPTRDQPGYLEHCIASLLHETAYPNFELVLVDHDTTDPDALDYLAELEARPELHGRIQLVRTDGPFNYARLLNLGAEIARGEHLVFLDNDTQIVMPEWLSDLVALQLQTGAALVAPRLSRVSGEHTLVETGPRLLGITGLAAGMASEKTNLLEPGYCGRLQVAQEVSATAGSCIMVRRCDFAACNGMDADNTPIYESTLDLCLRLQAAGHKLIWTPWVNVAHHGSVTRKRLENDVAERARLTSVAISERNHLWRTQLQALAHDPNYSRHLSLTEPFAVEPYAVIDWDLRFHDRLRVLGLPLTSGSGEYRMTSPFRALQAAGMAQTCVVHPMEMRKQRVLNPIELARAAPDVLMLQQAIDDVQIGQLKLYRQYNPEVFITYAVDDVLGNLPRKHYLYNFQAREGRHRLREGLSHCDRLIASTEPIADYCRDMVPDIVVVPNRLERSVWVGHESRRGTGKKPRVGWAGAQQHLGDLELIKDVVEALKDEVEWVFMGMCPEALRPYVAEEHPFVSYSKYPAKLASLDLDLAIAPLEQHLFNEGKSNLRLLEYGIMGWPVVCTDIYPYRTNGAPVKRVQNLAADWLAAIRERLDDLDAAYREGDALRNWVMQHYILEDHLDEWLQAVTPR